MILKIFLYLDDLRFKSNLIIVDLTTRFAAQSVKRFLVYSIHNEFNRPIAHGNNNSSRMITVKTSCLP
jgi:hypothetical protein